VDITSVDLRDIKREKESRDRILSITTSWNSSLVPEDLEGQPIQAENDVITSLTTTSPQNESQSFVVKGVVKRKFSFYSFKEDLTSLFSEMNPFYISLPILVVRCYRSMIRRPMLMLARVMQV
jgi:hypothetical protein